MWTMVAWLMACSGETEKPVVSAPLPVEPPPLQGPLPALLMVQSVFADGPDGKKVPQPARLTIWRTDGQRWSSENIEDPSSNVFHKAMPFEDGILTVSGEKARVTLWKHAADGWKPEVLVERAWGGPHDRFRDVEVGDVNGDGVDELVLATHDQGIVMVGARASGAWTWTELDRAPDTFVHEVEIGDVDGDKRKEFYATPSGRNRADQSSQSGGVVRYDADGAGGYKRTKQFFEDESHFKEILAADVNGDGVDELYGVREAVTVRNGDKVEVKDPVRILRFATDAKGEWKPEVVATLDDRQCRFLSPGDVDGDGKVDLVAAGWKSGLWVLRSQADGTFAGTLVDATSTAFENVAHVADLDGDGKVEIYNAPDDAHELRRYTWNGTAFDRTTIGPLSPSGQQVLTWNLQSGKL
jgi:hypothetical protein